MIHDKQFRAGFEKANVMCYSEMRNLKNKRLFAKVTNVL